MAHSMSKNYFAFTSLSFCPLGVSSIFSDIFLNRGLPLALPKRARAVFYYTNKKYRKTDNIQSQRL